MEQFPDNRSMPPGDVVPEIPYPDVVFAAEWLCKAFGFRERLRIGTHRIQLAVGAASVVITDGSSSKSSARCGHRVMVRVGDADSHSMRAMDAGARITNPPTTYPFGERQYTAEDFAGQLWTFSQTVADVDPRDWGGVFADRI